MNVKKSLLSIDYASKSYCHVDLIAANLLLAENLESADYLQPGDVGFKKPKVCISMARYCKESSFSCAFS